MTVYADDALVYVTLLQAAEGQQLTSPGQGQVTRLQKHPEK